MSKKKQVLTRGETMSAWIDDYCPARGLDAQRFAEG